MFSREHFVGGLDDCCGLIGVQEVELLVDGRGRLLDERKRGMISSGIRSPEMRKFRRERSVWAPHKRSVGTSMGPSESDSTRVFCSVISPSFPKPYTGEVPLA